MTTLTTIYRYPLKSGAPQSLLQASVLARGLEQDRRWMLVDAAGRFVTGRSQPMLTQVRADPVPEGLQLAFDGMDPLLVPWPTATSLRREASIWRSNCQAQDCGDAAAHWFQQALGLEARLLYMDEQCTRDVDSEYGLPGDQVSFADGFPLLLISEAALELLNCKLQTPVSMLAFRPNLMVSGCAAHAEDEWKQIRIGAQLFDVVKRCTRCVFTTVDPELGRRRDDGEPLNTLKTYRRSEAGILFGQNLIPRSSGSLHCGDTVTVLK